jgi:uncharacterized membrane protein
VSTDPDGSRSRRRSGSRLISTGRLEAFSDGVFAIAITLLVLELHVPTGPSDLLEKLGEAWPEYLGYAVSFAFIGGTWIAHSNLTRFLKATDNVLMQANLLTLLFVSLLPFSTNLMATHLDDSGERVAVVVFGLNLTFAALMLQLLILYAHKADLAADDVAEEELRDFERERRAVLGLQALATVVGLFFPGVAVGFFLLASLLLYVQPFWHVRRRRRHERS